MKLGLFGAARPSVSFEADSRSASVRSADASERLVGLTPVELAAAEALAQPDGATLAVR
jgi:hypothetical protein